MKKIEYKRVAAIVLDSRVSASARMYLAVVAMSCTAVLCGEMVSFETDSISGLFDTQSCALEVHDKRCGHVWKTLTDPVSPPADGVRMSVTADGNELVFDFAAPPSLAVPATFLALRPLEAQSHDRIFVPMGCGYSFPAEGWDFGAYVADWDMSRMRLYTGFMKMACFAQYSESPDADGVMQQGAGALTIIETPTDAETTFTERSNGRLGMGVEWRSENGRFGYARRLRVVFFDHATPGALAARYRAEMDRRGFRVTFVEKAKRNPRLAEGLRMLKGAPNIWYWTERRDKAQIARELRRLGFGNMLFSTITRHDLGVWVEPSEVRELVQIPGVLTTEYDIVHDAMEPKMLPKLDATRPHWPPEVWERGDYVMDAEGRIVRGWKVALKDDPGNPVIGCLKICQACGGWYMRRRIRNRLAEAPYSARFYDVTGTGIAECHNPRHPLTLRQAVSARREMLGIPGREFGLVTGTEEGLECFVPECDYLEGNFSAFTWRVDGGRNMWKTYEKSPDVMKYAIDPATRYPFWEMVFHDCVSSYWYWTDYNNRFLDTWWQRDALNAITGTAPMYLFTPEVFAAQKTRLAESVKIAARTARETADTLLIEYRWLSSDRLVQQSRFFNGFTVTVNFSERRRVLADGQTIGPHEVLFAISSRVSAKSNHF